MSQTTLPRLRRSLEERMIAGVCGGLARYFQIDPTLVRLGWVLFTLLGGSGVLAYLIAWALIPDESGRRTALPLMILLLLITLALVPMFCFMCLMFLGMIFG
ncbi:PspC domain-containing protein [Kallotenue papyrolyticum]|uniref:PspC domain-containing protein n=1 Tax=Kallotenue papyrolyticum TaxID=1325125 RepID=UPI0004B28893|nr:PspC domain-containing protein [Kallotenue papyrolyticum]